MPTTPKAAEPRPETLTAALARVQADLPHIQKTKEARVTMKGGGEYRYKYADLSDIQPLVLPLLAAQALTWVTRPTVTEHGMALAYELTHDTGEQIAGVYPLPDARVRTAQEMGSAITYARRYVLCCVLGIVPDEDEDGALAVSSQKEADARRAEEEEEARQQADLREKLLSRVRWAAERLQRSLADIATAWTVENGDHIATTTNLRGLDALGARLVEEVRAKQAEAEAAKPATEDTTPATSDDGTPGAGGEQS